MARKRGTFYIRVDDDHFGDFQRKALDAAERAAFEAAERGAAKSRSVAPRKTGALVGSIKAGKAKKGEATIEVGVPYGVFQEFGTSRGVEGKHFIRIGVREAQRVWPELVAGHM